MGQPIVHFDIIGQDPRALRQFYGQLFDWSFEGGDEPPASAIGEIVGNYGVVEPTMTSAGMGIPGGVGGGPGFEQRAYFYVGVPDVEQALQSVERLGGKRVVGPCEAPDGSLVVGLFADPEGHLVGLANVT